MTAKEKSIEKAIELKLLKIAQAISKIYGFVPESYSFNVKIEIGEPIFETEIAETIYRHGGKFEEEVKTELEKL